MGTSSIRKGPYLESSTSGERIQEVVNSINANCPSDTNCLLLPFHSLGGCKIPDILFDRARSPQHRWTACGRLDPVTAIEAGLDQQLADLLSDETRLIRTIQNLDPLVKKNISKTGSWTYSLDNQLQTKLSQSLRDQVRAESNLEALKWIGGWKFSLVRLPRFFMNDWVDDSRAD